MESEAPKDAFPWRPLGLGNQMTQCVQRGSIYIVERKKRTTERCCKATEQTK